MKTNWQNISLKNCLILGNGKARPNSRGNIPVYGGNGILDFCDSYNYDDGTIIIGRVGAYCGSVYINYNKIWISDNALSAKAKDEYDLNFLYYFLHNLNLNQYAEGAAHPLLTHSIIYSIESDFPPLPEQRAIASALSSLDDKINLLHRQNATLEAMAEALFKQWFVVEAKEEWEAISLGDLCDCITDKFDPQLDNNKTKYIGLEHIDRKKIYISRYGKSDEIKSIKFKFDANDILFGKLRPYFHKICFTNFNGVCSTDVLVLRPKNINLFLYSLFAFYQKDVVDFATYCSSGTRMPRVDWNTLKSFELYMPDTNTLENFNHSCMPLINKITSNQIHISTLEKLRDSLLPKLMSGEVRVNIDILLMR